MKRKLLQAGAAGFFAIVGALAVVSSGIVPIKASAGHWAATSWLLRFAKERSAATHAALADDVPPLHDPGLVRLGAAHFDTGCAFCHGDPTRRPPVVPQGMLPKPPPLGERVSMYSDEELFQFVKHGIKFTGMPAWPAQQRDDEVHAVVAFLRALPRMSAARYVALARGPAQDDAPAIVQTSCGRCHGAADADVVPKLAGQSRAYLELQLDAYARAARPSGIMQPVAAGLTEEAAADVAAWYARQPPVHAHAHGGRARADRAAVARGRAIAVDGIPARRVASCVDCHGPGGARRNPAYPVLAGQHAAYIENQLRLFVAGRRGGSAFAEVMHASAHALSPREIDDVAAYYASADPTGAAP